MSMLISHQILSHLLMHAVHAFKLKVNIRVQISLPEPFCLLLDLANIYISGMIPTTLMLYLHFWGRPLQGCDTANLRLDHHR